MSVVTVPRMYGRRRDWFRVIRCLMKAGVSMNQIARKCDRDPVTVKLWADGSEPRESDARVVLALFAKHCPEEYVEHQKEFEVQMEIAHLFGPQLQPTKREPSAMPKTVNGPDQRALWV